MQMDSSTVDDALGGPKSLANVVWRIAASYCRWNNGGSKSITMQCNSRCISND